MSDNHKIPGLPDWPELTINESKGECVIYAKHLTYRRICFGNFLNTILMMGVCAGVLYFSYSTGRNDGKVGEALLGGIIILFFILLPWVFLPAPKMLTMALFPKTTRIRYKAGQVIVNRKKYKVALNIHIQFRASNNYLSDHKLNSLRQRHGAERERSVGVLKQRFRKVEMVYGSKLVCLAVIADEEKAEQFAIVLQFAYLHALQLYSNTQKGQALRSQPSMSIRGNRPPPVFDDALPE